MKTLSALHQEREDNFGALRFIAATLILFFVVLTYGVFYSAYQPFIKAKILSQYVDFSYGLYLYGWPMQQMIEHYFKIQNAYVLFVFAFLCALLLSIASWFLIEKPCLALKKFSFSKKIEIILRSFFKMKN